LVEKYKEKRKRKRPRKMLSKMKAAKNCKLS
jgi:hypothetical protein